MHSNFIFWSFSETFFLGTVLKYFNFKIELIDYLITKKIIEFL